MKILLVTDSYPPEIRSASHLMKELAEELCARKNQVTVLTCQPRYNLADGGRIPELNHVTDENGVRVVRVHTPAHHKVNFFIRGLSQMLLPFLFWFNARSLIRDGLDAVVVYSPPLTLWLVGFFAKRKFGAKFILNVQDIFPQNAIDLGVLRNPVIIKFFEEMEDRGYRNADLVTVHSDGNRRFLESRNKVTPDKLITLHNWININHYESPRSEGPFREKLGLSGKFIFFFGGVLGPSQGLELVIQAAARIRDNKDVVILLVGDGTEKPKLMEMTSELALNNVVFQPFVSREDYESLLKEMDVGLVCLSSMNRTPVVPGKLLSYMAAGIPVLALLNRESDGHQVISEAECGYSCVSDNPSTASELMLKMYDAKDALKTLGENGHRYAVSNFSRESCVNVLEEALRR